MRPPHLHLARDAPTSTGPTATRERIIRRAVHWMLLNRQTGRVTVVQWPNISLLVFILLSVASHLNHSKGAVESFVRVLADVALLVWAGDELVRGVNPFRRILGLVVIVATIASMIPGPAWV
jgi:hypothetical protein